MIVNATLAIDDFDQQLEIICSMISDYQSNLANDPVVPQMAYDDLFDRIEHDLPGEGVGIEQVLADVQQSIIPYCSKVGHPRFLAWMNNSSSPAGLLGDLLTSGLAQMPFTYKGGPAATVLEDIVIRWYGQLFGYPEQHGGTLVSGGTVANLTALLVAREIKGQRSMKQGLQHSGAPLVLYMSDQGHMSIERAVGIMGIGTDFIRKIPTDTCHHIRIDLLREQVKQDLRDGFQPFCVVAQAGAANTGAVDPIAELAAFCAEYQLWLHVDAAYGGGAILTETGKRLLRGIERADSITVDPHKWFFMPVEAGLTLIRDREALFKTFSTTSCKAYQGPLDDKNYLNYGVQISRTSRALKIWFALRVYGLNRIAACVNQNLALAQDFSARLRQHPDWEVLNNVELSIICFRYVPGPAFGEEALNSLQYAILERLEASGVALLTPANLNGKVGIRLCFANHRTSTADLDILFEALTRIGNELVSQSPSQHEDCTS